MRNVIALHIVLCGLIVVGGNCFGTQVQAERIVLWGSSLMNLVSNRDMQHTPILQIYVADNGERYGRLVDQETKQSVILKNFNNYSDMVSLRPKNWLGKECDMQLANSYHIIGCRDDKGIEKRYFVKRRDVEYLAETNKVISEKSIEAETGEAKKIACECCVYENKKIRKIDAFLSLATFWHFMVRVFQDKISTLWK